MKGICVITLVALLISTIAYSADITTGLAGHWSFDNCDASDSSGNSNNGINHGAQPISDGIGAHANSCYFNGINNYIEIPFNNLSADSDFSISYWIKYKLQPSRIWAIYFGNYHSLININTYYGLTLGYTQNGIFNSTQNQFYIGENQDTWTHFVTVYDMLSMELKTYMNSILMDTKQFTGDQMFYSNIIIGKPHGGWAYDSFFKGMMSDLRIYNRALSVAEVKQVFDNGNPYLSFPLKGYTPYTAGISSIYDHHKSTPYESNGYVVSFAGEEGTTGPIGDSTCYGKADGSNFGKGYNYVGTSGTGGKHYLCYDGHPGIDYPATLNTPIYAPANGTAHIPTSFPGYRDAQAYNTLEVDHGNGIKTYYLHLTKKNVSEGDQVYRGITVLGYTGDYGSPGSQHLHFEVHKEENGIWKAVDPYGYQGVLPLAAQEILWEINPPCLVGTNSSYTTIQSAYNSTSTNDQSIQLQSDVFKENVTLNKNINILLQGGYSQDFTLRNGQTTIFGTLTISTGSLVADGICIK